LSGRAITSLKYILNEGSLQRKLRPSNLTTMFLYNITISLILYSITLSGRGLTSLKYILNEGSLQRKSRH